MNAKKYNHYLDTLIAALAAKRAHEEALRKLVASCGGKRTLELMECLLACMQALYPTTDAVLSVRKGAWNVSFPNKGAGYQTWKDMILPHLPKLRAATGGKKKSLSAVELAANRIAALRDEGLTKAQAFAAVELAFSKRK